MKFTCRSHAILILTLMGLIGTAKSAAAQIDDLLSSTVPAYYAGQTEKVDLKVTHHHPLPSQPRVVPKSVQFTPPTPPPPPSQRDIYDGLPKEPGAASPSLPPPDQSGQRQSTRRVTNTQTRGESVADDAEEEEEEDGELEEHIAALDRWLESSTVQRILGLMEENMELRAELRVHQVESKVQLQLMELKLDHALEQVERTQDRRAEDAIRRRPANSEREVEEVEVVRREREMLQREIEAKQNAHVQREEAVAQSQQLRQQAEKMEAELRKSERGRAEAAERVAMLERRLDQLQQHLQSAKQPATEHGPRSQPRGADRRLPTDELQQQK